MEFTWNVSLCAQSSAWHLSSSSLADLSNSSFLGRNISNKKILLSIKKLLLSTCSALAVQILSWFSSSILSISALERSLPNSDLASRNLVSAASARQLAESTAAEEEGGESTASYARKWIFLKKVCVL